MLATTTTEQLCRKLNRLLKTLCINEVIERLGDRCEEVHQDDRSVTGSAKWCVIDDHAIAYVRMEDEFVPVRLMGGVPQSAWYAYDRLGIGFK